MTRRERIRPTLFDFEEAPSIGERAFFRIFEVYIVASVAYFAWVWAGTIPQLSHVIVPLGLARHVDLSFMLGTPLGFVNAGLITVLLAVGYLRLGRWAYIAACLLVHVQFVARFSQGYDPHGSQLLGIILVGFALAQLAFDRNSSRLRFSMGFAYFFLGVGYTSAGVAKLVGTGFHWPDGHHLWLWIGEKSMDALSMTGVYQLNWLQSLALDYYWLASALLLVGLLTELCAFLVWWRPLRRPVTLAILALHVGIFIAMDIRSTFIIGVLIMLALPWARWLDRVLDAAPVQGLLERTGRRSVAQP